MKNELTLPVPLLIIPFPFPLPLPLRCSVQFIKLKIVGTAAFFNRLILEVSSKLPIGKCSEQMDDEAPKRLRSTFVIAIHLLRILCCFGNLSNLKKKKKN